MCELVGTKFKVGDLVQYHQTAEENRLYGGAPQPLIETCKAVRKG